MQNARAESCKEIRQFHVLDILCEPSKPQTWNKTRMKQAAVISTPTHRE
jgi:hypothetical protein